MNRRETRKMKSENLCGRYMLGYMVIFVMPDPLKMDIPTTKTKISNGR